VFVQTIGLRELNQNPSKAVARVRAGSSLLVTDRGRAVLQMIPADERPATLDQMIATGEVSAPVETGMPDLIEDLAPDTASLAELVIAERDAERAR